MTRTAAEPIHADHAESGIVRAQESATDFYLQPAAMTGGGSHAELLERLPDDVGALVQVVQGLSLHEYAASAYDVTLSPERRSESHIRQFDRMLDRVLAADSRPLTSARPPARRLVGVCHHFMVLLLAMLRAKGIPARGRYGFGIYFNPGYFEEHVVCEYWNVRDRRWVLVDAQLDDVWQHKIVKIDFDPLDVPRDRFLVAGEAWARCREGKADASRFGIFHGNLRGLWFIAGELIRDAAALNKVEMLPWDVWGGMPRQGERLSVDRLAFFDRLAALTRTPDASFAELRMMWDDERVRVPNVVFNALRNQAEDIVQS